MNDKTEELSWSELSRIATLALYYYEYEKPQREIAELVGVSQTEVSRCIKLAKKLGIVSIKVDPAFTKDLGNDLKKKFPHLDEVRIVPYMNFPEGIDDALFLQRLGTECAKYFLDEIPHAAKIGVSCGNSVEAVVNAIGNLSIKGVNIPYGCHIYPMIILMMPEVVSVTPASLVANLVKWLPESKGKIFQLPSVTHDGKEECAYKYYSRNPQISDLLLEIENLDYYLIGIGFINYRGRMSNRGKTKPMPTHEFNSLIWDLELTGKLKKYDAVGESLYQPFDSNGEDIIDKKEFDVLRNRILYLPLRILRERIEGKKSKVIAVAGGKLKHDALRAALHSKIFNVLITDSLTAEHMLLK